MKIKVCGMTTIEQLQQLQDMGVDYAGMIFYEGSKRYASEKLRAEQQKVRALSLQTWGVFVNQKMEIVLDTIAAYGLKAVQLHGDENPEYCRAIKNLVTVVKVFRINDDEDVDLLVADYRQAAHYFLFDTGSSGYGGSGKKFNWRLLENAVIGKPFFLSGGIGLEDLDGIKKFRHPFFYGIDVNSRFEITPGIKNMDAVKKMTTDLKAFSSAQ